MTTCRMVVEPCVKKVCQTICETVTDPCVKIVPVTVCETQTIQCVRKVPYTTCRQVAETKTICCPVTVAAPGDRLQDGLRAADGLQAGAGRGLREGAGRGPLPAGGPAVVPERAGVEPVGAVHHGAAVRPVRQPLPDRGPQVQPLPLSPSPGWSRPPREAGALDTPDRESAPGCNSPGAFLVSTRAAQLVVSQSALGDHALQPAAQAREGSGAVAELMLDERAQLAEGLVVLAESGTTDRSRTRPVLAARGSIARGRHPRPRAGSLRTDRPAPAHSETPRRGGRRGLLVRASSSLRLLASSSVGSPAYRADKTPGAPPSASTVRPESSAMTQRESARASSTPSCGRCRRTCRHPRRPPARRRSRRPSG